MPNKLHTTFGLATLIIIIFVLATLVIQKTDRVKLERWEAMPIYEKANIIEERRSNDKYCQSGNIYEELCNDMYDEQLRAIIKNDHVGGN